MSHSDYVCKSSLVDVEKEPLTAEHFEGAKRTINEILKKRDIKHISTVLLFAILIAVAFLTKAHSFFVVWSACILVFSLGRMYSIDMERNKNNELFRPISGNELKKHNVFYLNDVVKNPATRNYIEAVRHQERNLYVCELNSLVAYCLENKQTEHSYQDIEDILMFRKN